VVGGWRLNHALAIDEEQVTATDQLDLRQHLVEAVGVQGGAKDIERTIRLAVFDGYHQMRHTAKAQKHVADIQSPLQHFAQPRLTGVILALKVIGPDIAHLLA